jgi:hypothetical protein
MTLAGLLLAAITVHSNFEAGSIGKVEFVGPSHLRCAVKGETDQEGRNRQPSWFYFRLDGVRGRELVIELTDLHGEYNYRPHDGSGHRNMRPVYSYDNEHWRHFESSEWNPALHAIRVRFTPEASRVWIARQPPYTTRRLARLLDELRGKPEVRCQIAGRSVRGRPIWLLTVTNFKVPDAGKKVIWWMARQHAWESGTSWVTEGALRYLVSGDPHAARIRDTTIFLFFPMADPDGVHRGGVRFNEFGYDLNRNWDAVDPRRMPEIACQRQAILNWVDSGRRLDLFLTLHNTESSEYIEGPLSGSPEIRALGERLWKLLVEQTAFHSPGGPRDQPASTDPGRNGRMTVNQALYQERRIPAFLMELMVDPSPRLGRPPSVEDRLEFGAALVRVLRAAVEGATHAKIEN